MSNQHTIGVFDSGIGGITVLKELVRFIPNVPFIYFADTANCPYGPKGAHEIMKISDRIAQFLTSKGSSMIVVACNTATASAIDYLRANHSIPFIGMEPAVKPAALESKTKSIGVLATEGTFNGRLYRETTAKYAADINIVYRVGLGLVELVEQGKHNSQKAKKLLDEYLKPMIDENIDHLVLGCTHYPFFIPLLKKLLPPHIKITNPAAAVARQAQRVFLTLPNSGNPQGLPYVHFYSTGKVKILKDLVNELELHDGFEFTNKDFFEASL